MSLSAVGVWQVGVWDQTVWVDGVWREGAYALPLYKTAGLISIMTAAGAGAVSTLTSSSGSISSINISAGLFSIISDNGDGMLATMTDTFGVKTPL